MVAGDARRLPAKTQISPPTAVALVSGRHLQSRRHPEVVAVGGREHHGIQGGSGVAPDYVAGTSRRYAIRIRTGLCHGTAADQKSLNGECMGRVTIWSIVDNISRCIRATVVHRYPPRFPSERPGIIRPAVILREAIA